ncbi:MAG: 5-formyltetrahydrofolate cyclo-ligase [Bacteroidales bacterium]|nr:5-formyltetrahydrofolate cyclo-ligase [Bacteroidales bacterium]
MSIDEQKQSLRKTIRALKKQLSEEERLKKSKKIWTQFEQLPEFQQAQTVMLYWSMQDEVDTHNFVVRWANQKRIILPSVDGDMLVLKEFTGLQDLKAGERFGILEPSGKTFEHEADIDLIVVPGVAFDHHNNRMGRGKAYYDKTLKNSTAYKVGICFNFQFLDSIPTDQYDVKMDAVIHD